MYTQQEGVDFIETFSLTTKLVTIKVLFTLAANKKWLLHQLDVNNASFNDDLFEEVDMDLALGYKGQKASLDSNTKYICKTTRVYLWLETSLPTVVFYIFVPIWFCLVQISLFFIHQRI